MDNRIMPKPTTSLFITVLVGVQNRTCSLWFSLKNNDFHRYETTVYESFCFITMGA